jgi:ankyrin repeat protein
MLEVDHNGWSKLHYACLKGDYRTVELLLDNNTISVNLRTYKGVTALQVASARNYPLLVQLLLEKGAEVNAADAKGHTALFVAAEKGHVEVARVLLRRVSFAAAAAAAVLCRVWT